MRYGRPNLQMSAALEDLGAHVAQVATYRWELPNDIARLHEAARRLPERQVDVVLLTSSVQLDHLYEVARLLGIDEQVTEALAEHIAIASVGPVMNATLESYELPVDIVPNHPKTGALLRQESH